MANGPASPYECAVLLTLIWEEPDHDVLEACDEAAELRQFFSETLNFRVDDYEIPTKDSQLAVNHRVTTFLLDHGAKGNLVVLYYAGHGNLDDDRTHEASQGAVWVAKRSGGPTVNWTKIRNALDFEADALLLADCCNAGAAGRKYKEKPVESCFELFVACNMDGEASLPGPSSFTRTFIRVAKQLIASDSSVTMPEIHHVMVNHEKLKPQPYFQRMAGFETHISLAPMKPRNEKTIDVDAQAQMVPAIRQLLGFARRQPYFEGNAYLLDTLEPESNKFKAGGLPILLSLLEEIIRNSDSKQIEHLISDKAIMAVPEFEASLQRTTNRNLEVKARPGLRIGIHKLRREGESLSKLYWVRINKEICFPDCMPFRHGHEVDEKMTYEEEQIRRQNSWILQRVGKLAALLNEHWAELQTLKCVHWVEDGKKEEFGLVFEVGREYDDGVHGYPRQDKGPISLQMLLHFGATGKYGKPSRLEKYQMATRLAKAVTTWHERGWIHGSMNCRAILFLRRRENDQHDWCRPFLRDFAGSHPRHRVPSSWSAFSSQPCYHLHPHFINDRGTLSSEGHEIYALGTVLLEIVMWSEVSDLLENVAPVGNAYQQALLSKVLDRSGTSLEMNEHFRDAVTNCLTVSDIIAPKLDDQSPRTLHRNFGREVVRKLEIAEAEEKKKDANYRYVLETAP